MPITTRFQNAGWEAIATAGLSNVCTLLTERIPACPCRLLETLAHLVLEAGAEFAQLAPGPAGPRIASGSFSGPRITRVRIKMMITSLPDRLSTTPA